MKLFHAYTKEQLKRVFIYDGLYYPVIGSKYANWNGRNTKTAWTKKLGGWRGFFSFLPTIGIKCKLKNPDRPFKQLVIDAIKNHKEMELFKWYADDEYPEQGYMYVIRTKKGDYIGSIDTAYSIAHLKDLKGYESKNTTICYGYDPHYNIACGWSHRAKVCFGIGDKIFDKKYGDKYTLYREHGKKTIKTYSDMMKSALNFAKYIA